MKSVSVSELKARCFKLVEEVAQGRGEVVITKRGRRVARLVPAEPIDEEQALSRLRGTLLKGERLEDFETCAEWNAARE